MYCSQCGTQISETAKFCHNCGASSQATVTVNNPNTNGAQPAQQPIIVNVVNENTNTNTNTNTFTPIQYKSRWLAFALCLFGGWIGAHKFYLGKTGMGLLYMFTFGIFGIGWFIDTISLLFNWEKDKWGNVLV
jgi:restriction system protein